ncbi:hypothetical protein Tco_0810490 [Tanacetum coccineum]
MDRVAGLMTEEKEVFLVKEEEVVRVKIECAGALQFVGKCMEEEISTHLYENRPITRSSKAQLVTNAPVAEDMNVKWDIGLELSHDNRDNVMKGLKASPFFQQTGASMFGKGKRKLIVACKIGLRVLSQEGRSATTLVACRTLAEEVKKISFPAPRILSFRITNVRNLEDCDIEPTPKPIDVVFLNSKDQMNKTVHNERLDTTWDKIKEGTLKVDQGTDAITVVLGKEKEGYARGVGSGVTYKRYFDLPRSKQVADERILLLQIQLDAARRERQEKELLIHSMSSNMSQTEGLVTKLKTQLAAQGGQLQSMPTQLTPLAIAVNSSADEEGGRTVVGCDQNDASIRKEMQKGKLLNLWELRKRLDQSERILQVKIPNLKKMCRYYHKLWPLKKSTIITEGTVYKSDGKIMLHDKVLPKDCNKVSIDKSLVDAEFIPDVGNKGCTTVLDAVGGFVAWPNNQVVLDPKATPPSTIQMITGENKTAPKVQTKRKNVYVSSDAMQKEAKMRISQKALVY